MVKEKPIMVAELSINHLGMVNIAKKMIDEAVGGGANLIKLKYKNVNKYYKNEGKKWRNFNFKIYRNSLELSKEDFCELSQHCDSRGIKWFCTIHDKEGLEFINQFKPPYYKIASMDSANVELVEQVMTTCKKEDKPLIISLGGKTNKFVESLVEKIISFGLKAYLLHTVSIYPTPVGKSNIMYISNLIERYQDENIKIGYSGHEVGYAPTVLAAYQGAAMIERHFSLSLDWNIHHLKCALTSEEYSKMNKLIDEILLECNSASADFYHEELNFLDKLKYT